MVANLQPFLYLCRKFQKTGSRTRCLRSLFCLHFIKKKKPNMDFVFRKSTKVNMKNYGYLQARFRSGNSAKYCALGLTIKEAEWEKYKSQKWVPSNVLTSLGIKYGDFASMLAEIKNIPDEEFEVRKIKKLIEKLINKSREVDDKEKHLLLNKDELLFSEYMLKYYEDLKSGKRLKKQRSVSVSKGYMEVVKNVRKSILKYEEACEKHFLLCDIDTVFRRSYIKWLSDQGFKPNTIQSQLRTIYTLMRNAFEDGLTKNDAFMRKGFVPVGEHVDSVYLSLDRIKELLAFDMTYSEDLKKRFEDAMNGNLEKDEKPFKFSEKDAKRFEVSRDQFIVGCLTGQRVSDFRRISNEMITEYNGKKFITLVQQKEKKKVMIPLDRRVKVILDKYDGVLPKLNETTFNKHLKIIAEVIGWTEAPLFEKEKSDGNKERRFCDMISSHTARRTFATIAYSKAVPLASIMAVTGHSTEEKLRVYLHLQAEDKAVIAAKDLDGFLRIKHKQQPEDQEPNADMPLDANDQQAEEHKDL